MVSITLEEAPLDAAAGTAKREQHVITHATTALQKRVQQLEEENKQLNGALEELDAQHNLAIQNVIEVKMELQEKLATVTNNYETLKKEHAEKFISGELELGKVRKEFAVLQKAHESSKLEKDAMQEKIDNLTKELRTNIDEMADLQALLDKKTEDNIELIEKVKFESVEADKAAEVRIGLLQKVEQLTKEVEELKQFKDKKTSESSTSSTGKQSEDEFIVVREGDANSSSPTTPPTKEELKDKIVQLENRVSELLVENDTMTLELQDHLTKKEIEIDLLKEKLETTQNNCTDIEQQLKNAEEQLKQKAASILSLNEKTEQVGILEEHLKKLTEEKSSVDKELSEMQKNLTTMSELEKRLLLSEQEKEHHQLELQALRVELESKMQNLTFENQQVRLSAETEAESEKNAVELEAELKSLKEVNEHLRVELESLAQTKFRQAIEEEKQEITDLDADEDEPLNLEKFQTLLNAFVKDKPGNGEDEMQKAYKALRDRLNKIDKLEKNLVQISEELLDLQDSKMVWDHEKKTLDADISQYIIQCDELMKNNEILLNELENYKRSKLETISENNEENIVQLEMQLEEYTLLNRTLEVEYAELHKRIDELDREKQELTEKLRTIQHTNEDFLSKEKDYALQLETLELEKSNLLFELNELKSSEQKETHGDVELKTEQDKCENLQNQLKRLSNDHGDLVSALQSQKNSLMEANRKRDETEKALREQEILMVQMREEMKTTQMKLKENEEIEMKLVSCQNQLETLQAELNAKEEAAKSLENKVATLQQQLTESLDISNSNNTLESKVLKQQQLIDGLQQDLEFKSIAEQSIQREIDKLRKELEISVPISKLQDVENVKEDLNRKYEELREQHETQKLELQQLLAHASKEKTPSLAKDNEAQQQRIAELETELLKKSELEKTVESLDYEKNEMIKVIQQKHNENVQYYMELQRLQPLLQQLQQRLMVVEGKQCEKCPSLESTIVDLRTEQEKFQDQINFLKEKADILTTNLLSEQSNQRLSQQEKATLEEQNAAVRKDLERLREHLLEIETLHTQEVVEMEKELEAMKAKMIALQDEVSQSSNAYTSASIRANQHAETLQAQYALLVQQRDELVNKLSLSEDRELKNQAALCNLQCALEQFQNDKEHDIKMATQRFRKELQEEQEKRAQLQADLSTLNQQLIEANQGLCAANRLSDQLEMCQQTIAALREEVDNMKSENATLEEKLSTSEVSQTDKIDKSLMKSLLIGYVVSGNPNDKQQVLRMITAVLDFTQSESDKIGLNKQPSSWLGAILGGAGPGPGAGNSTTSSAYAAGSHSKENLVQAFVQFLEQESQPKVNTQHMPNLLNITQGGTLTAGVTTTGSTTTMTSASTTTTTASAALRRSSVPGTTAGSEGSRPAPIPIQPLLINSNVLDEFAPTRNSSSILKDILNDS